MMAKFKWPTLVPFAPLEARVGPQLGQPVSYLSCCSACLWPAQARHGQPIGATIAAGPLSGGGSVSKLRRTSALPNASGRD